MRMRRKHNLEQRLADADGILFCAKADDLDFSKASENNKYIDFSNWFGNDNPIYLEIGCGKGQFSAEFAKQNPNINLVAVERSANVIVDAAKKGMNENIPNLRFIKCTAQYLPTFIKPKSVEQIILNFSCPFPKAKYAKHRLTHKNFLDIYKIILKDNAEIHQKTDNMQLFEFSIEQFSNNGFALKDISLDLYNSEFLEGNIATEYETKFVSLKKPIYRLTAFLKE